LHKKIYPFPLMNTTQLQN